MKKILACCTALVVLSTIGILFAHDSPWKAKVPPPGIGNPDSLRLAYDLWKEDNAQAKNDGRLTLSLAWSKGLSAHFTGATGELVLDLNAGTYAADLRGLENDEALDLWLVENRTGPGRTVLIEKADRTVRIGSLKPLEGRSTVKGKIPSQVLGNFDLDLVVVARAGSQPREGGMLYGTPDLFQRLYSRDQQIARGADQVRLSGFMLAVTTPLDAMADVESESLLVDLVAQGEDLFFKGTFNGNGRTCGSCHPAENNLTIDPEFISRLPNTDPLFIAENRPNHPFPDLVFERNGGRRFENPKLMREHGLIAENQDGFGDLANRFNMRSVPHVFSQTISVVKPPGTPALPAERTGWSGDGAPNNGALRDFATGAVTQHFTKTLLRRPNIDFVLPTSAQLTAMEAFQRSLGRQTELNLVTLSLKDAGATTGKTLFQDNAVAACNVCHFNAGANANPNIFGPNPANRNFNTGAELFQDSHPDGTGQPRPPDGGFGTNPAGGFNTLVPNSGNPAVPNGGFGDGSFNTPSIVEAADTLPAFHNNITSIRAGKGSTPDLPNTIEGSVEFYTRAEFTQASGIPIVLDANQIRQLGRFLRVINALENRRAASAGAQKAKQALFNPHFDPVAVNRVLEVAIADTQDGIEVLIPVGLHPTASLRFFEAQTFLRAATSGPAIFRIIFIDIAIQKLNDARAQMENV